MKGVSIMKLSYEKKTITITKAEAKKASIYGTDEYNNLVNIRKDFPNFKIVIKEAPKRTKPIKRLTFEAMRHYIESKNDSEALAEFIEMTGNIDKVFNKSYGAVKKRFLEHYPELDETKAA